MILYPDMSKDILSWRLIYLIKYIFIYVIVVRYNSKNK